MEVVKVTLSTKKVVLLRTMKISDTEKAAQAVSKRSDGDATLLQILMQKELTKNLIVQVDGKTLTATDKEDMDGLFSVAEYSQLLMAIKKMQGDDLGNEPALEFATFGDK